MINITTMITPPFEWKPIISSKLRFKSDPCQSKRTSMIPGIACMDPNGKIRETFSADKMEHTSVEKSDWKYKFKTGDLIRIPLSHIITDSDENEVLGLIDKKLNCLKWTHNETCLVSNGNLALPMSVKRRGLLSKLSQDNRKPHKSCVSTVPLTRGTSMVNISSSTDCDHSEILRDSIRHQHQCIIENQFGNTGLAECHEIPKTKLQNIKKLPFLNQPSDVLENSFRYKVNASELPRSKTPVSEKDPDRISFKKVASFLSDNLGSSISMDYKDQSNPEASAIETVNHIPSSNVPNEQSLEFRNNCLGEPYLKSSENTEVMNLVNADVFTSPSRSMHSSGAFKVSFRLRRAPNLGAKTKKEIDSFNVQPQKESKQRFKLKRFLDFAVSTREKTSLKDRFALGESSGEFLRVPSLHSDYGKQRVCDITFGNSQELISGCHLDLRICSASKTFVDISNRRQYTPASLDKRTDYKNMSVQKSKSDLGGVSVKAQTSQVHSKSWKNSENGSTIKSSQPVIVIPACTSVANDSGDTSDSGIISKNVDRTLVDGYSRRLANRTNSGLDSREKLNFASNLASVFSQQRNIAMNQRYPNQTNDHEHLFTTESKDYSPVKLTFRKEKVISHRKSDFFSKFFNSEENEQKKMNNPANNY